MRMTAILVATLLASAAASLAQDKPQEKPMDDMEHMGHMQHGQMQHGSHGGFMQEGMTHAIAKGVKLAQNVDAATHTITLREGPLSLPAHTDHMKMPQPPDLFWTIPVDGWLLAYHPKLVDASGKPVPGTVLHHTAFWNVDRSDFLCPNKEEHIFGAGSELTDWAQIPEYGYRVHKGDKIRIETMVHNPTDATYDAAYLEVQIPYADASAAGSAGIKSVYPAWMDAMSCRDSGYDLPAGKTTKTGSVAVKYDGVLIGVGGHLHDYGRELVLEDVTKKETVATLDAKVDAEGHLESVPVVMFLDKGGYEFNKGDQLRIEAIYDNTTGKLRRWGAMGIVVGYFLPNDDAAMAGLRRVKKTVAMKMAH